jgi:hypothetical protein
MGFELNQQHMVKTLSDLWKYSDASGLKCPDCQSDLILIQAHEIQDIQNPYQIYDTIIECVSCSYQIRTESYTVLGAISEYTFDHITIHGWSPSGSRVKITVEHILDYQLLKELKQSGKLVEFLIVDNHAIQVIG